METVSEERSEKNRPKILRIALTPSEVMVKRIDFFTQQFSEYKGTRTRFVEKAIDNWIQLEEKRLKRSLESDDKRIDEYKKII